MSRACLSFVPNSLVSCDQIGMGRLESLGRHSSYCALKSRFLDILLGVYVGLFDCSVF